MMWVWVKVKSMCKAIEYTTLQHKMKEREEDGKTIALLPILAKFDDGCALTVLRVQVAIRQDGHLDPVLARS